VRARVAFAALAVFAAFAIVVWGLLPGAGTGSSPAASTQALANPSASAGASGQAGASASQPKTPALTHNMHLVFDASFRGSTLNSSVWDTCFPWADQSSGCTDFGNQKEIEWYLPSQVHVSGGVLKLTAKRELTSGLTKAGAPKVYDCRSGMVTTHPGFNFKYGYIQVVARIPNGSYLWPALWLDPSNFSWPPEIDMLEHWGPPKGSSGMFFHPVGGGLVAQQLPPKQYGAIIGWQTFALDWTPSKLTWYLNGTQIFSVLQRIPHQKMYFIANLAGFKPNPLSSHRSCSSGTLEIRSVKVWQ
jgi:beta-glucanase (GH16 family)